MATANPTTRRWHDFLHRAAVALTLLAMAVASAATTDESLTQLMQQLARQQRGHVAFVERQYIGILERPLESSGELFYEAPDRLEKRTLLPVAETLVLANGRLTVSRGKRQYVMSLRDYPQIAPFVESIRATLAGDLSSLNRVYIVAHAGTEDSWTLDLTPREAKLAALVKQIHIAGALELIHTIEIRRRNGDYSVMSLRPVAEN